MKFLGMLCLGGLVGNIVALLIFREDFELAAGVIFGFGFLMLFGFFYVMRNTDKIILDKLAAK